MKAYKIFDIKDEKPKTLFHGVRGSRTLPVGEWIRADRKMVRDGSGQRLYESGFHAYPDLEAVEKWIKGAKKLDDRVVCEVEIKEIAMKPNAIRPTYLAQLMKISKKAWENRKRANAK